MPNPARTVRVAFTPTEIEALAEYHKTVDLATIERVVGKERRKNVERAVERIDNAARAQRSREP